MCDENCEQRDVVGDINLSLIVYFVMPVCLEKRLTDHSCMCVIKTCEQGDLLGGI